MFKNDLKWNWLKSKIAQLTPPFPLAQSNILAWREASMFEVWKNFHGKT